MSSPPVAFLSYDRKTDEHDSGYISDFRKKLEGEVRLHVDSFEIFQDQVHIRWGQDWEQRLRDSLDEAAFLIPVLTPRFLASEWCRKELELFAERERKLGRKDLILPLHYIETPQVMNPARRAGDELAELLAKHQIVDWKNLRFEPLTDKEPRRRIAKLAKEIVTALEQSRIASTIASTRAARPTSATIPPAALTPPAASVPSLVKPPWAASAGADQYGEFATIAVPMHSGAPVTQRLRWIEPDVFWMGSSDDEPGRTLDEGPLHRVDIRQGFWLFETPCTQALWQAVMSDNRSRFVSPTRPVENISFQDVEEFLTRINVRLPGLALGLPSEAQWEFACRAGTRTATYAGHIDFRGKNNAPVLDAVAWYAGNSGVDFDLAQGHDSSRWPEKQYPHTRAGTRPVGLKRPNAWGLHDMLGNVWEWCADTWHSNYDRAPSDGSAWIESSAASRVVRGGNWGFVARSVRAASRNRYTPDARLGLIGFRCVRVQAGEKRTGAGRSG